ncbi:hypothetical protein PIB30_090090 [Stylosanthes scabra]|uniref:Bifunctional inhibitor/plant lipid transfer protein/seed storage helical domain-containing protein n=1 Tax=Stylosanthes scabra TaxID=79078 RepID=A0ABU6ZST9_9FABA|nr:hypothetical protein [Stylosanthes scabra]
MASRLLLVAVLMILLLAGYGRCDLAKDREECADKLVGLAGCIPYVSGEAKTPTIDCCSGLKVILDKSKKCICILIKDRNDPNLGITINATLAVQLPASCHAPANISQCVDLLHLAPNSPDAKVFEGFGKSTKTNTTSSGGAATAKNGPSSSAQDQKSDGGEGNRWHVTRVISLILPSVFISHFFL